MKICTDFYGYVRMVFFTCTDRFLFQNFFFFSAVLEQLILLNDIYLGTQMSPQLGIRHHNKDLSYRETEIFQGKLYLRTSIVSMDKN